MSDWWSGFISGILATIFGAILGFILTVLWDFYKFKRELKRREETVISVLKEELESNLNILLWNVQILQGELKVLAQELSVVQPLSLLKSGFWDMMKINLPQKATERDILLKIRRVAHLTDQINEQIRSRENYRINNQAMSNYCRRMELYDQTLLADIERLVTLLEELKPLL